MRYAMTSGGIVVPEQSPLLPVLDWMHVNLSPVDFITKLLKPMLLGMVPNEGEKLLGEIALARILGDRDADLLCNLFTNVTISDATVLTDLTRPTGTGTGAKTLTDGTWSFATQPWTYTGGVTWTAGADWGGLAVQGYDVETQAAGGTARIMFIEDDDNGPYTVTNGDEYLVTPKLTIKDTHGGEDN